MCVCVCACVCVCVCACVCVPKQSKLEMSCSVLKCVCSVLQCVAVPKQSKLEFQGAYSCLPPGSVHIYATEFISCIPLKFAVEGMSLFVRYHSCMPVCMHVSISVCMRMVLKFTGKCDL